MPAIILEFPVAEGSSVRPEGSHYAPGPVDQQGAGDRPAPGLFRVGVRIHFQPAYGPAVRRNPGIAEGYLPRAFSGDNLFAGGKLNVQPPLVIHHRRTVHLIGGAES